VTTPTRRVETTADLGLVGHPDGPVEYIEEIDMFVPTYIDERRDLWPVHPNDPNTQVYSSVIMHHVPLEMRGPYKDDEGKWELCWGVNLKGLNCKNRAFNRSGYCSRHGGALHPLDKRLDTTDPTTLPRWMQFRNGYLKVEDLTDEELLKGRIRNEDGTLTRNKDIPRELWDRAVRELFGRADQLMQESLLDVINAIVQIAKCEVYEPADRQKAAIWLVERVMGKAPDRIIVEQEKPWETVMTHVAGGSRAESRAARGLPSGDPEPIDAEVIGDEEVFEPEPEDEIDVSTEPDDETEADDGEASLYKEQPYETIGPLGKELHGVPVDPEGRNAYYEHQRAERERVAAARKEFKDKMNAAKKLRYVRRSQGKEEIDAIPYVAEFVDNGDGTRNAQFRLKR